MFKKFRLVLYFLMLTTIAFASPSTTINVPNSFSPNTTISSSAMNANFNEVTTKFNTHTHTDITQLGVVTSGTWAATPVQSSYVASGAGAITGEVRMWAGTTGNIPSSWLACDGSSVSRTTYAALFAIIGTNYGTVDSSHFTLPNWNAGKFVKGSSTAGTSAGADTQTATGTTDSHTLSTSEVPALSVTFPGRNNSSAGSADSFMRATDSTTQQQSITASTTGSGGGHTHTFTSGSFSIVPTNQTAIYMIKT